jgi:hypothetical protein
MITKALAYYAIEFIEPVKRFMVQAQGVCIIHLIMAIINYVAL